MDDMGLTKRYKTLQKLDRDGTVSGAESSEWQREMDDLYARIVDRPIASLRDAVDKLDFAYHCVTEEDDYQEAANLVRQVSTALANIVRRPFRRRQRRDGDPQEQRSGDDLPTPAVDQAPS